MATGYVKWFFKILFLFKKKKNGFLTWFCKQCAIDKHASSKLTWQGPPLDCVIKDIGWNKFRFRPVLLKLSEVEYVDTQVDELHIYWYINRINDWYFRLLSYYLRRWALYVNKENHKMYYYTNKRKSWKFFE